MRRFSRQNEHLLEIDEYRGKVEGKTCILIDDMIDTAGTGCRSRCPCWGRSCEVYQAVHQFFQGQLWAAIQKSAIKKIGCLDTIYLPEERWLIRLSKSLSLHLLGDAIIRIHEKRPLSPLLFGIEDYLEFTVEEIKNAYKFRTLSLTEVHYCSEFKYFINCFKNIIWFLN